MKKIFRYVLSGLLILFSAITTSTHAADYATVIMYHRFDETNYPSTNTTLEQFEAHLDELTSGNYTVLPLIKITRAILTGESLPDRSVAITIDDAFLSVYEEAFPRLRERDLPFTVFVATSAIDHGLNGYANWDQLREMQAAGVDFGSQTHTHPHLHTINLDIARNEIEKSNSRFIDELGIKPQLLAYPYGEYTPEIRDLMKEMEFIAAFGQNSGVMSSSDHHFEFPRFAFNQNYGDLSRLKLALNALPVPFSDFTPESMVLENNPPLAGFTVDKGIEPLHRINCFAGGMGRVETTILSRRVEIRLPQPIINKRGRINCTMPYFDKGLDTGRWRWLGRQFLTQ
jgi:peptidoglycan/xylan/chitin deacetylase (PgdA/CDA1 family)